MLAPRSVLFFAHHARRDLARLDSDGLVNDPSLLGVVAHFDIARYGEILAERMADKAVIGKNAAQVRMPFEHYAEQIECLAFEPVHAGPDTDERIQHGEFVVRYPGAHAQPPIVGQRQQVRHDGEALRVRIVFGGVCGRAPAGIIDPAQIDTGFELQRALIAQRDTGVDPGLGGHGQREFAPVFGKRDGIAKLRV